MIAFEDPLATERRHARRPQLPAGRRFHRAARRDARRARTRRSMELSRLLRPEKYAETARIARLQPYDPNKTVVLVIHGLKDSPATWTPMINHLRARREDPHELPVLVLQLPERLSVSVLRRDPAAGTRRGGRSAFRCKRRWSSSATAWAAASAGCSSPTPATSSGCKFFGKPPEQVTSFPGDQGSSSPRRSSSATGRKSGA